MTSNSRKEGRADSSNTLAKPQKVHKKNKYETLILPTTVWRVARKHLVMKPYKLQLVQAITADDKQKRKQFCVDMQEKLEEDEFNERLVFSDEATFPTNGKVNRHNVRIWGKEKIFMPLLSMGGTYKSECILCHLEKPCSWPVFL